MEISAYSSVLTLYTRKHAIGVLSIARSHTKTGTYSAQSRATVLTRNASFYGQWVPRLGSLTYYRLLLQGGDPNVRLTPFWSGIAGIGKEQS